MREGFCLLLADEEPTYIKKKKKRAWIEGSQREGEAIAFIRPADRARKTTA